MSKKWKNRLINILIAVLLLTSVVLIFKNQIREYLTGNANNKIITAYKNGKGEVDIPWWQKLFTDNASKIKLTDSMLGILKIDSVNIQEPIFQDVTEINLINGLATAQEPSTLDAQNVVIAGHKLRTYEVSKLYNVAATQVEILEQHKDQPKKLTLFTCDNYNPKTGEWESRFVVEAKLVGEESA